MSPVRALDCNEIGDIHLEVQYEHKKLKKLCTDEREMKKRRSDIAGKLRLRIKALETAKSVGELSTHDPLGNGTSSALTGTVSGRESSAATTAL